MAIYADNFVFNGKNAKTDYNLMICDIGENKSDTSTAGSSIELQTVSSIKGKKWILVGTKYKEPISFSFQAIKYDATEFTVSEIENIERWLIRTDEYKWFNFLQEGYENAVFFNATCVSANMISVGNTNIGMEFTFQTDAPFGYSPIITKTLTDTLVITDMSGEIGSVIPDLTITVNTDCDVSIYNSFTNETFTIYNCLAGEIITIDSVSKIIKSNLDRNIYDDFNLVYLSIGNDDTTRNNTLTLTGDATVTISYREIRKVGV